MQCNAMNVSSLNSRQRRITQRSQVHMCPSGVLMVTKICHPVSHFIYPPSFPGSVPTRTPSKTCMHVFIYGRGSHHVAQSCLGHHSLIEVTMPMTVPRAEQVRFGLPNRTETDNFGPDRTRNR